MYIVIFNIAIPLLVLLSHYFALIAFYPPELALFASLEVLPGVFLYFWFIGGFITSSRLRCLESWIGLPSMIRLHISNAIGCVGFLIIHYIIKYSGLSLQTGLGLGAGIIMCWLILTAILQWVDIPITKVLIQIPFIRSFHDKSHARHQYQYQRRLHNIMLIAGVLAFVHVSLSEMFTDIEIDPYSRWIFFLYTLFAFSAYFWHKILLPWYLQKTSSWVLDEVRRENAQVTSLIFTPPAKGFSYRAGQFGFLRFTTGKLKGEEHPFSLSSHPDESQCVFTIQNEGDFTGKLNTQAFRGDLAIVDGPYGKFYPNRKQAKKPLLFIAGGIGIVPFLSLLKEYQKNPPQNPITVFWLINPQKKFFSHTLDSYRQIPNVDIQEFSRSRNKPFGMKDLKNLALFDRREVFICASKNLTKELITMLRKIGTSPRKIHYELFSM